MPHVKPKELHNLSTPWPFHTWGMDLLGPFQWAVGQLRFMVVAIDYFTKWIEDKAISDNDICESLGLQF
jgi:hypothetical protein